MDANDYLAYLDKLLEKKIETIDSLLDHISKVVLGNNHGKSIYQKTFFIQISGDNRAVNLVRIAGDLPVVNVHHFTDCGYNSGNLCTCKGGHVHLTLEMLQQILYAIFLKDVDGSMKDLAQADAFIDEIVSFLNDYSRNPEDTKN